jgi:hypothetical protein
MTSPRALALSFAVLLGVASCASDSDEVVAEPGALGHIHDLVLTDDDTLLVASHGGLYRIDDVDRAVLVGTEQHDLMSMSADADGLLASGHPDLRLEKYRVEDHPPHLGLARSADFGQTWTVEADLLGRRDFHALVPTVDGVFAVDAQGTVMLRHPDGAWVELGELAARDLAVNPDDSAALLGTDYDSQVWRSDDGGQLWRPLEGAPELLEIDWNESGRLVGAQEDGTVWTANTPDGPWTSGASEIEEIETLHTDDGQWWLTAHGGAIHTSTDAGQTWEAIYLPPEK